MHLFSLSISIFIKYSSFEGILSLLVTLGDGVINILHSSIMGVDSPLIQLEAENGIVGIGLKLASTFITAACIVGAFVAGGALAFVLGSIAVLGRNQGIAVVLNMFFGTLLNAAYGVANQLNVLVSTFAATITTVFSPIIMKYKGQGDKEQMLYVASLSSKISFLLSSIMALPILLELDNILNIWLTEVPKYTLQITSGTIITFVIMQMYPGLTRALYAEGHIKWYQIVISVTILLVLPLGYILFKLKYSPVSIIYCMIFAQILVLIETVYFSYRLLGFGWKKYFIETLNSAVCFCSVFICGYFLKGILNGINIYVSIAVVALFSVIAMILLYYVFLFSSKEKKIVVNSFINILNRK